MRNARAGLLWALTVMIVASATRNPLYILVVLLITTAVELAHTPRDHRGWPIALRFALIAIPLAALFNGLTVHLGETVLFRLPEWLPLLGGPVTAEALVYGATNGLTLAVIFSGFATFNQATPVRDLVRLTPRAFHEAGVVLSIALTFIPQMKRNLARIREAQAIRGHRVRGLRDWLPIFVPLLVGGLERAMGLAEAMVARGYGATADRHTAPRTQLLLALGLMLLLLGWLVYLLLPQWHLAASGGMIAGVGLIGSVLWWAGRSVPHTTYRVQRWSIHESLVVLGCVLALTLVWAPWPFLNREALYYSAYPQLSLPPFDPITGLGLLGLLVPALFAGSRMGK